MRVHDGFCDREADPVAAGRGIPRSVGAVETVKKVRELSRIDLRCRVETARTDMLELLKKFLKEGKKMITVEVQLRTIAMDFWASLEHQLKYKKEIGHAAMMSGELKQCADDIASVDLSMQTIRDIIEAEE